MYARMTTPKNFNKDFSTLGGIIYIFITVTALGILKHVIFPVDVWVLYLAVALLLALGVFLTYEVQRLAMRGKFLHINYDDYIIATILVYFDMV